MEARKVVAGDAEHGALGRGNGDFTEDAELQSSAWAKWPGALVGLDSSPLLERE